MESVGRRPGLRILSFLKFWIMEDLNPFDVLADRIGRRIAASFLDEVGKSPLLSSHDAPRYYTRKELASQLRLSLPTITRLCKDGTLEGKKVGRKLLFEVSQVEKALEENGGNLKYKRSAKF